jgi:1,4-alpha-glucan branching enzyme
MQRLVRDLNHLYRNSAALYAHEFEWTGFDWIDCSDSAQSVLSFVRRAGSEFLIVVVNLTPVPRRCYRIGVPEEGAYSEIFNSDSHFYGGSNIGNGQDVLFAESIRG